jgi:hypothetical protein
MVLNRSDTPRSLCFREGDGIEPPVPSGRSYVSQAVSRVWPARRYERSMSTVASDKRIVEPRAFTTGWNACGSCLTGPRNPFLQGVELHGGLAKHKSWGVRRDTCQAAPGAFHGVIAEACRHSPSHPDIRQHDVPFPRLAVLNGCASAGIEPLPR